LTSVWDATGPLEVGRVKFNSGFQDYFTGDIDDVNIWDRAVSDLPDTSGWDPEIHDLATQPPANQGLWAFDEGTGTSAADSTSGHPVTLSGPAVWDPEGRDGADVTFDGASVYGATAGSVIRTDGSLTVSAWVRMRSDAHTGTVVSQAGSRNSGFQLYYSALYQKWVFNRHLTDTDNPAFARAMSNNDNAPELDLWTHLVGVFDLTDHKIRLYVNGQFNDAVDCPASWNATGPLEIGRVKYNGGFQDYFQGDIDDVRVYAGALTDQQVLDLDLGTPPTPTG
jgi:Concanavalin A-like lectin/glucanases superfamily